MHVRQLSGESIRLGRTLKGWSQRTLGEKAGLKKWRVWALENEVYAARPDELARILKALSIGDATGR